MQQQQQTFVFFFFFLCSDRNDQTRSHSPAKNTKKKKTRKITKRTKQIQKTQHKLKKNTKSKKEKICHSALFSDPEFVGITSKFYGVFFCELKGEKRKFPVCFRRGQSGGKRESQTARGGAGGGRSVARGRGRRSRGSEGRTSRRHPRPAQHWGQQQQQQVTPQQDQLHPGAAERAGAPIRGDALP